MKLYAEKLKANRFSCLAMMITMLLFGASGMIEAMDNLAVASASAAVRKALAKEAAEAALKRVGTGQLAKATSTGARETAEAVARESLEAAAKKSGIKFTPDVFNIAVKNISNDIVSKGLNFVDDLASGTLKLTDEALDMVSKSADNMIGVAKNLDTLVSKGNLPDLVKALDDVGIKNADVLGTKMINAQKILIDTAESGASKSFKAYFGLTDDAAKYMGRVEKYTNNKMWAKTGDYATQKAARKTLAKLDRSATMNFTMKYGKMGGLGLMGAVGVMGTAILFMIPSIFQSAFMAQQMHNSMLETYLPPIKFGNVVLQLPDSVVNMGNPIMSQFIYYGIPVNNPGQDLSKEAKAAYPGVSGPSANNKLSKQVDNSYAQAFTAGGTKKISIERYNLDAKALATLPVFVSYSDQSWLPWASNGIPDPSFSQKMINLNTGYILYADGSSAGMAPAPLIGPKGNTDTVQSFMQTKLGSLSTAGSTAEFKEYVQAFESEKAGKVHGPINDQFNCKCLLNNNGVLSADTIQTCSANSSTCLLSSALNQLSAGLVINSQGKVMTPDQDLAAEVAQGALGQVIPIQGLGANFDAILQMFPGAQQDAMANSGALTISLGTDLSSASKAKIQGADPDNYTAKGVYIYQCKNTPLAKILKSQSGGGSATANNQITDFIVFLDADLNQVPMMAPVQDLKNYGFMSMGLNPVIKYFSTVIGSFDENGNFNFLPQLNIQSPAALVAKGLPESFAPLYSLQAANGSLAVNYNQNLTSAVGGVVQGLMNNPKLGHQFKTMQSAMLGLLGSGPYGQYNLNPVPTNMQPVIGGTRLNLYTGFNSYPVSQDQANANCSDVLIPLSAAGKTVTLPSDNVTQYYGLVTDLTYNVQQDGSIVVDVNGFENSPLSASWTIDEAKAPQFYWMDKLTEMGQGNDSQFAMPQPLVEFVEQARLAWINWIQATANSGLSKAELTGIQVVGTSNIFTIASQQALKNGLYVYTYTPCPSSSAPDYFVLTNSSAPQANDSTLGKMSASKATAATNMLSIVSGQLYNASGNQVKSNTGAAYSVDASALLQSLNRANPNAFSNDLKIKLNISVGQAASAAMAMVYPFQFANLQLGLYQEDINAGVYLYFDAAGAGASENFQPSDYFVTIDSYTTPSSTGTKLSGSTGFVVSLVSGQVYGPAGVVAIIPATMLNSILNKLSGLWRVGVAADIANLTAQISAGVQKDAQVTAEMDAAPIANSGIVTFSQASAMQVINNLASVDYLAEPYSMLKQDSASGMYVVLSPASLETEQLAYTFFNVPSTILDAQGKPTKVGAMYDDKGNLLRAIQGVELASMMKQYGVAVDSTGKQYLGAGNALPILQLDPADLALQPGKSGKSMLISSDPNFPSYDIVSPISYQNSQFYFYYNTIIKAYYAMQVTGSDIRYIDMAGGCVYNLNGSPRIAANPVAVNSNGDATDLFLSYTNLNGFVRCVMKNANNNGAYSDFYNFAEDFQVDVDPATNDSCGLNLLYSLDDAVSSVNVTQMPFDQDATSLPDLSMNKQYNVYFDQSSTPVSYNVNATYTWQQLQILPINMSTRALLQPLPADIYSSAGLIHNKTGVYAMVFAGQFYSNVQKTGTDAYTMKSGASSIAVLMQMDSKTNIQYMQVIADGMTYNYQLSFLTLSEYQFSDYRRNAWQSEIVADVTGTVLLEKYITVDASGNLQLAPVSMNNVVNVPTDPVAKSALSTRLGNILKDNGNGNFMTQVAAGAYPYFTQGGFVDLENGVLFDTAGFLVGYTLQYVDFMQLLSQLQVVVLRDSKDKAILSYRAPMAAPINPALSSLSSSKASTASSKSATISVTVSSTAAGDSSVAQVTAPASAVSQAKSPVASASSSDPQVVTLEQENARLQADIVNRQNSLNATTVAHTKQTLQNAIMMKQQQISKNNKKIVAMRAAQSASSRATVLGRLGSKLKKKSSKSQKKNKNKNK